MLIKKISFPSPLKYIEDSNETTRDGFLGAWLPFYYC